MAVLNPAVKEIEIPSSGAFRISASAGSGKTHNLTRVFIRRMLVSPQAYRGMLAITFTNKAANELRGRILKRLSELTDKPDQCGESDFFGLQDARQLSLRASEVLEAVLHQPDFLQVGTIDSFFQQVFSVLSLETGLPGGLKTELDIESVKSEMLEKALLSAPADAVRILVENLSAQLKESGKDWRTIPYLRKKVLDVVFEEPVVSLFIRNDQHFLEEPALQQAGEKLRNYCAGIKGRIAHSAAAVLNALASMGISPEDFDPATEKLFFNELQNIRKASDGSQIPEKPIKSHGEKGSFNYRPKSRIFSSRELAEIKPLLENYGAATENRILQNFWFAESLLFHIGSIRLLLFFRAILQQLNQEQHRFLLQEVKFLLAGFLDSAEVPYLFERTGNRLHTLLIDEFQDTDHVQWQIIKSLAQVVMENNGLFSVVGDVKQSIYGWRGADSSLFKGGMDQDLYPFRVQEASLRTNFRSLPLVVRFNNWMFSNLAQNYATHLVAAGHLLNEEPWGQILRQNYADVEQFPFSKDSNEETGFVHFRVRPKQGNASADGESEEEEGTPMHWLPSEIMRLQDAGFKAADIAVLVRRNSDLTEAMRILDKAQRSNAGSYDFSFTTAANEKAGNQALFLFLMLAIRHGKGKSLSPFELEQMGCLAAELKLDAEFLEADWHLKWKCFRFREQEPDRIFLEQAAYFRLSAKNHLQSQLVQFEELLMTYLREDFVQYPDIFTWWEKKASEKTISPGEQEGGITLITIHRSKGLDFGVVILPLFSTGQGDARALHDAYFWAFGEENPWNSHPLLRGKGSKKLLESDLGVRYQQDVFHRAAEALNTFYVACTRPRFGLVIDVTMDGKLEKNPNSAYRLPYQAAALLMENRDALPFPEDSFDLKKDENELLLEFRLGRLSAPQSRESSKDAGIQAAIFSFFNRQSAIEVKEPADSGSRSVRIGLLVHRVLERIPNSIEVNRVLQAEALTGDWDDTELAEALEILTGIFEIEKVKNWFSDDWASYPETGMISKTGEIYRADRVLLRESDSVILDFKTGEPSESDESQISQYRDVFRDVSGKNPECWLIYTRNGKMQRVP
jgi:ATP-dependent helicase/nuclease subunit A